MVHLMFSIRSLILVLFLQLVFVTNVFARDFDWLKQLSVEAQADPAGFVARVATRFHVGNAEVQAVVDNIGGHADAYMVMRLAEMSHHPVAYVSERYPEYRKKGWGSFAKSLGIKPGSKEFHALKAGHDLDFGTSAGKGKSKKKSHGKHKDKPNKGHGKADD